MQHFIEKWDSYLGKLLGLLIIGYSFMKPDNPVILAAFKYYIFLMMAVVVIDTLVNFTEHESAFWKAAAIGSNVLTLFICVFLLQHLFGMLNMINFAAVLPFVSQPAFLLYLGVFVVVENFLWTFVFEHF